MRVLIGVGGLQISVDDDDDDDDNYTAYVIFGL